jgi:hypothetical protein
MPTGARGSRALIPACSGKGSARSAESRKFDEASWSQQGNPWRESQDEKERPLNNLPALHIITERLPWCATLICVSVRPASKLSFSKYKTT